MPSLSDLVYPVNVTPTIPETLSVPPFCCHPLFPSIIYSEENPPIGLSSIITGPVCNCLTINLGLKSY